MKAKLLLALLLTAIPLGASLPQPSNPLPSPVVAPTLWQSLSGRAMDFNVYYRGNLPMTALRVGNFSMGIYTTVPLCGNETDAMNFDEGDTIVVVFSRVMHRRGCFQLFLIERPRR